MNNEGQGETLELELVLDPEELEEQVNDVDTDADADSENVSNSVNSVNSVAEPNPVDLNDYVVQVHYYPSTSRVIARTLSTSLLSISLVGILLLDLVYSGYLRATLSKEEMRYVKHVNWEAETIFLIFESSLGVGIALFVTINVLAQIKIENVVINTCLLSLGVVALVDGIWIVSEQNDRRHWQLQPSPDPMEQLKATLSHQRIRFLLETKVVEIFLLAVVTLIWLREWHEYDVDFTLRRRQRPVVAQQTRTMAGRGSCRRTLHDETNLQGTSLKNPPESGSGEQSSPMDNIYKNSVHFTTINETERNKVAKQEFREKGDGHDIDVATPRVFT